jgi:Glycosyl hydrolase catalytic core
MTAPLKGKKGVCLKLTPGSGKGSCQENMPRVLSLRPYWNYNWAAERAPNQPEDLEFIPMVWGSKDMAGES